MIGRPTHREARLNAAFAKERAANKTRAHEWALYIVAVVAVIAVYFWRTP